MVVAVVLALALPAEAASTTSDVPHSAHLIPDAPDEGSGSADAPAVEPAPVSQPKGLFMGDEWRYGRFAWFPGLVIRVGLDVISIPTSAIGWSGEDWAITGGIVGSAVVLAVPINGVSLDVRIQRAIRNTSQNGQHGRIWTPYGSFIIYTGVAALAGGMLAVGTFTHHDDVAEAGALAVEGMVVAEIYHIGLKLLLGREGPENGKGLGRYTGPSLSLFPNGMPSGHASALGGFIGALVTYYDLPLLNVILDATVILLSVALITDNLHWTSDVIVGLSMGYAVGRWVVHHRSSRYRNDGNSWRAVAESFRIGPTTTYSGAPGVGVRFDF